MPLPSSVALGFCELKIEDELAESVGKSKHLSKDKDFPPIYLPHERTKRCGRKKSFILDFSKLLDKVVSSLIIFSFHTSVLCLDCLEQIFFENLDVFNC